MNRPGQLLHVWRTRDFRARVRSIEPGTEPEMIRVVLEVPKEDQDRVEEMADRWSELTPSFAELRDKRRGT